MSLMRSGPLFRAARAVGTGWHIGTTMARRGLLTPGRPDRIVRQVSTLAHWGLGLAGEFGSAARRNPGWTALVDEDGPMSFAELDENTDRLARALTAGHPDTPPRVGVLCRNHRGMVATLIACGKTGADAVLFNTGLSPTQVRQSLLEHDVRLLIADAEFLPLTETPDGVDIIVADGDGPDGLRARTAAAEPGAHDPPAEPGRTIVLTSGTTGTPKGARRPRPALHSLTALLSRIPLRVGDRIHIAAPMFHTWGYAALQLSIAMRGTIVLRRRFTPETLPAELAENDCTVMFAVPVMLQRLLEQPAAARHDSSRLRVVATSGSGLPGDLAHRFMDTYGDILYNLYGTTEVSWISIATPGELRADPATSGRPPHGTTVLLLDDDGAQVPTGTPGRIFVGNEMLFEGYTDGSARSTVDDTMDSGDLGHRDASGLLFVDGRADDMIISGGENVFGSEVENLLARMPQVREVAVVGVADDQYGQRLVAHIVVADGHRLDGEAVRDHVRTHLARFSVPRDVHFPARLPRNATGKVVPRLLVPPPKLSRLITTALRRPRETGRGRMRRDVMTGMVSRTLAATVATLARRHRLSPFRPGAFAGALRGPRTATVLGRLIAICFMICLMTGLYSHFLQEPLSWMSFPTRPVWLYRLSQGLHVATGTALIPLLLAKLWTVYPRLFTWPAVRSPLHALERLSIAVLVSTAVLQLVLGFVNTVKWYPWPFSFRTVHFWLALVILGSLLIHIAVKLPLLRRHWRKPAEPPPDGTGWSRRGFFAAIGVATAAVTVTTVGQAVTPLGGLALLAPRRPGVGPQGLPVNRTAANAKVIELARDPGWRLTVAGPVTVELSLDALNRMPQHDVDLPIACVEGWSQNAHWTGVRLRDLLELAEAPRAADIEVSSLEPEGHYRTSRLGPEFAWDDTSLLALRLGGEVLHIEHGYPARIITPARPGVLQTKWVESIEVLT